MRGGRRAGRAGHLSTSPWGIPSTVPPPVTTNSLPPGTRIEQEPVLSRMRGKVGPPGLGATQRSRSVLYTAQCAVYSTVHCTTPYSTLQVRSAHNLIADIAHAIATGSIETNSNLHVSIKVINPPTPLPVGVWEFLASVRFSSSLSAAELQNRSLTPWIPHTIELWHFGIEL